jgi:ribose transport system substrate-binding protein
MQHATCLDDQRNISIINNMLNNPPASFFLNGPLEFALHTLFEYSDFSFADPGLSIMRDVYLIKSVAHAARLLESFQSAGEILSPNEILARTGLSRGIVHRLLYTLEGEHVVEKLENSRYRLLYQRSSNRHWKIGYGAPGIDNLFTRTVADSLRVAVDRCGELEMLALDHRYKPAVTLRNAEQFIRERVNLVIDYQIDEEVGAMTAHAYRDAHIPVIAVNNPHPGATYFGANNYEAGLLGGRCLGKWARAHWNSEVDQILMLELRRAGVVPKTRMTGMVQGIREVLGQAVDKIQVIHLDGDGHFDASWRAVRKHLRSVRRAKILVGAMNDNSALGVLRAFDECGRSEQCAILCQNGTLEARQELRKGQSRLVGSVAYFPETYGEGLVRLALDILSRRFVAPAVLTQHRLLTANNVDHVYPNDPILGFSMN